MNGNEKGKYRESFGSMMRDMFAAIPAWIFAWLVLISAAAIAIAIIGITMLGPSAEVRTNIIGAVLIIVAMNSIVMMKVFGWLMFVKTSLSRRIDDIQKRQSTTDSP